MNQMAIARYTLAGFNRYMVECEYGMYNDV